MILDKGSTFITRTLHDNGFQGFIVGGSVRDYLMGKPSEQISDYDIITDATPEAVMKLFPRTIPTGLKHGTVTVLAEDETYEVTTFRTEGEYKDCRHPEEVAFVSDIREDLLRRDFTINAMAYDPSTGEIIDRFDGRSDLAKKLIKAVGDPDLRFKEDALRIIRGIRFAARFGFNIDPATLQSMAANAQLLENISKERIYAEFKKIALSPVPSLGMNLLLYTGALRVIMPELLPMAGFNQFSTYHDKDVWFHTMQVMDHIRGYLPLRLAALFHDTGKPFTHTMDEQGNGHFYGHEEVSAAIAETVLTRLKIDKATREMVTLIIGRHMVPLDIKKQAKIKKLITEYGKEHIHLFFEFKKADYGGKPENLEADQKFIALQDTVHAIIERNEPLEVRDLAINGTDLLNLGFAPGKSIGETLRLLLNEVILNPDLNNREDLIRAALRLKGGDQ